MSEPVVVDSGKRRMGFDEPARRTVVDTNGNGHNRDRGHGATNGGVRSQYPDALERAFPMNRPSWQAKRLFDVLVSAAGLIVLSPVLLVAAFGVKITSRGPIVFRQPRVGRDGRIFTMYKFRTYPVEHIDDKFSREHDECPLIWGRFLRRTSIDELPQMINVFKGDMSLVGPRPERPHFAAPLSKEVPDYEDRHRVPGGITGAAQVQGLWGNSSIVERVRLDNTYIEEWSFRRDLRILARTPVAMVRKGRLADCTNGSEENGAPEH